MGPDPGITRPLPLPALLLLYHTLPPSVMYYLTTGPNLRWDFRTTLAKINLYYFSSRYLKYLLQSQKVTSTLT